MDLEKLLALAIGPYGAAVLAIVAAVVYHRRHAKDDERRDSMLERQMQVNEKNADAMPALTEAVYDAIDYLTAGGPAPAPALPPRPVRPERRRA